MAEIGSIACGLPFCQSTEGHQTNLSIGLRVAAIVLGILAVVTGALILFNIPGLSQLGTTAGWSLVSMGALLIIVGASIKYIKKQSEEQVVATKINENLPNNEKEISSTLTDTHQQPIDVNEPTPVAEVEKPPSKPLKYIGDMAAMPLRTISVIGQQKVRFMQLDVLLDCILTEKEPDYLGYVETLIAVMQKLQNFDPNLIFGVSLHFADKEVSLMGQESKFQEFAKTIFCNLIEKYIGGQTPQDGSQKLNLLSIVYNDISLQDIVREWVDKAIPLISLNNIVKQLCEEKTSEAEQKLSEFMDRCAVYELSMGTMSMVRCNYTPLGRIMEGH